MDHASCSVSYFWHRILYCLENRLGGVAVASWLDKTEAISLENNQLVLKECSAFRREIIARRALAHIQEVAKEEFNLNIEVVLLEE